MAFTATLLEDANHGNHRVRIFSVSADAASGMVVTGLNRVAAVSVNFVSCTTAGFRVKRNLNDSSAAANGNLFFSACASTDTFEVICFGG